MYGGRSGGGFRHCGLDRGRTGGGVLSAASVACVVCDQPYRSVQRLECAGPGVTGGVNGGPVVASPLYKQPFSLRAGRCLEDAGVQVKTYPVLLDGNRIRLEVPVEQAAAEAA